MYETTVLLPFLNFCLIWFKHWRIFYSFWFPVKRSEICFLWWLCKMFYFLNWTHSNMQHSALFPRLFKTPPLQMCFKSSGAIRRRSTHICNGESGPLYQPKWDPFWCDIWKNHQCMGEHRGGLVPSDAIGGSPPLVTDAANDPEQLLVAVKRPRTLLLAHFTYPSSVLLSVSPLGLLFLSPSIVLPCLLVSIHHPNAVLCPFSARSDSLCGPRRPWL